MQQDSDSPSPQVLLLTANLMATSRVSGVVRGHELVFQAARSVEQLEAMPLAQLRAVVVDLDLPVDFSRLDQLLPPETRRIAYGPHVDREKLQAAAELGWEVQTRGEFDATLPQQARQWAGH